MNGATPTCRAISAPDAPRVLGDLELHQLQRLQTRVAVLADDEVIVHGGIRPPVEIYEAISMLQRQVSAHPVATSTMTAVRSIKANTRIARWKARQLK
jgi:hypothetical protein